MANATISERINEVKNVNINLAIDTVDGLGLRRGRKPTKIDGATDVRSWSHKVIRSFVRPNETGFDVLHLVLDAPVKAMVRDENDPTVFTEQDITEITVPKGNASSQLINLVPEYGDIADDGELTGKTLAHAFRGATVVIDVITMPAGSVLRDGEEPTERVKLLKYFRDIQLSADVKKENQQKKLLNMLSEKQLKDLFMSMM